MPGERAVGVTLRVDRNAVAGESAETTQQGAVEDEVASAFAYLVAAFGAVEGGCWAGTPRESVGHAVTGWRWWGLVHSVVGMTVTVR